MGREIKRVTREFNWPLDKVWKGFINPYYDKKVKCEHCDGSGSSPVARRLHSRWYGWGYGYDEQPFKPEQRSSRPWTPEDAPVWAFAKRNCERTPDYYGDGDDNIRREALRLCELWNAAWSHHLNTDDVAALIEANRLWDFTHTWKSGDGWKPKEPLVVPTPEEVNAWSLGGMGHDAINCWAVIKAESKRLGVETGCSHCGGEGHTWPHVQRGDGLTLKQAYENWTKEEPPKGDCYQLWETVSEGSPVSPVFDTPERLALWLVENDDSVTKNTTYEQWMKFIVGDGWAPSMVLTEYSDGTKTMTSGVEAICGRA